MTTPPRTDALVSALEQVGLDVRVSDDEPTVLWSKVGFLAPLALLTPSVGAPAGVAREQHPEDFRAVVAEVASVARVEGASVDEDAAMSWLEQVPASVQSSMHRDAAAGRVPEVDAIGVVRAAARHSVPVPVTGRLVDDLRARHAEPDRSAPADARTALGRLRLLDGRCRSSCQGDGRTPDAGRPREVGGPSGGPGRLCSSPSLPAGRESAQAPRHLASCSAIPSPRRRSRRLFVPARSTCRTP
jgi:hypothetical protein